MGIDERFELFFFINVPLIVDYFLCLIGIYVYRTVTYFVVIGVEHNPTLLCVCIAMRADEGALAECRDAVGDFSHFQTPSWESRGP